jgi:hypothetical protein
MKPFAATSIPLQDRDVIEDRLLALGAALRISLTSALGNRRWRADRALVSGHPRRRSDIAGNQHDEEKFGSQMAPELQISDRNVVTITSSSA